MITGSEIGYGIAINGVTNFTVTGNTSTAKYSGSTSGCTYHNHGSGAFLYDMARSTGNIVGFTNATTLDDLIRATRTAFGLQALDQILAFADRFEHL